MQCLQVCTCQASELRIIVNPSAHANDHFVAHANELRIQCYNCCACSVELTSEHMVSDAKELHTLVPIGVSVSMLMTTKLCMPMNCAR